MHFPNAAAGLITTASGYARFLLAATMPGWGGLLSKETCKEITVPRCPREKV
jgi:hypothetical protein